MAAQQENHLDVCEKGDVSIAWHLKGGINKLGSTLKMQERNILFAGRMSLEQINRQLDTDLLPIFGGGPLPAIVRLDRTEQLPRVRSPGSQYSTRHIIR